MAAIKPSFEADDSRLSREVEASSAATVNGSRSIVSPAQNTSFRPDPSAFPEAQHQDASPQQQVAQPQHEHKSPSVDRKEGKTKGRGGVLGWGSPDSSGRMVGKRKRSADASFLKKSPEFVYPPSRRQEGFEAPVEPASPGRSLPRMAQTREDERLNVT
jgi:hypothetical protein